MNEESGGVSGGRGGEERMGEAVERMYAASSCSAMQLFTLIASLSESYLS